MKTALLRPLLEALVVLFVLFSGLRWVLNIFSKKPQVFRLTAGRQLRLAFWPLLALGAGLSAVPAVAMSGHAASSLEWSLGAGFIGLTLLLGGPALLLHARYWLLNQGTDVVFEPDANRFEIYEHGQRQFFAPRDILKVERVTCRARRTFWAKYDYLRLHLADGRVLTLTSLLADLEPVVTFLRSVPTERRAVAWCWV